MAELAERERTLLEQAASWRLIGLVFERPKQGWAHTMLEISEERAVDESVASLATRAADEGCEADFLDAFGPGGRVSPREVSYRHMGDPGRILAELNVMYDAFSFIPCTEEPPDHVSVEVGFVGFLLLKEAYSLMMGDEETAAIVRDAAALFIREHLAFLVAGLDQTSLDGYMREAVDVLLDRIGPVPSNVGAGQDRDVFSGCAGGCSFGGD